MVKFLIQVCLFHIRKPFSNLKVHLKTDENIKKFTIKWKGATDPIQDTKWVLKGGNEKKDQFSRKKKSFKMELEYPNLIKPEMEIIFYFKDLEDYKYIQMSRLH